jgi:IS5 family transposase
MSLGTGVSPTVVDAAPSSATNSAGERDPETHQTKKGNQWYFGMKAHIGVDADSGLVHGIIGTAANVNDVVDRKPNPGLASMNPEVVTGLG